MVRLTVSVLRFAAFDAVANQHAQLLPGFGIRRRGFELWAGFGGRKAVFPNMLLHPSLMINLFIQGDIERGGPIPIYPDSWLRKLAPGAAKDSKGDSSLMHLDHKVRKDNQFREDSASHCHLRNRRALGRAGGWWGDAVELPVQPITRKAGQNFGIAAKEDFDAFNCRDTKIRGFPGYQICPGNAPKVGYLSC